MHICAAGRGYECVATREYLRAGALIHSAYFDASLTSLQRLSNVWEASFFFEGWREWVIGPHTALPPGATPPTLQSSFISSESYRDTLFAASALTLSIFMHEIYFPNEPFDPSRLGSNGCEHYFGTVRSFVRNRNNFCLLELLDTLTRVVGDLVAREQGDVAFPQLNQKHASRASRAAMQAELERLHAHVKQARDDATTSRSNADPTIVAGAMDLVLKVAEEKAAVTLAKCGIQYAPGGESSIGFRLPPIGEQTARVRRPAADMEDHLEGEAAPPPVGTTTGDEALCPEDYLCEIYETWLTCWQEEDVSGALSALDRAHATLQALEPNALFREEIRTMALAPDTSADGTPTGTDLVLTGRADGPQTEAARTMPEEEEDGGVKLGRYAALRAGGSTGETTCAMEVDNVATTTADVTTSAARKASASAQESSPLMVLHDGEWKSLSREVAKHDGRIKMGALNRKERFFVSCREYFIYEVGTATAATSPTHVHVNDYAVIWHGGRLNEAGAYVAGDFVLGQVESIWLKPTAKSAFPKSFWALKNKGDVWLRLKVCQPETAEGTPTSFKAAKQFGWHPANAASGVGSRAFINVRLHFSWIHTGAGNEIGSAVKTEPVEGHTNVIRLITQPGARTRATCEQREKVGLMKVAGDKAAAVEADIQRRRAGPIESMQKGDLVSEIKKVYEQIPKSWSTFKRPELQALLGEMMARNSELHRHATRGAEAGGETIMTQLMRNALLAVRGRLSDPPSTAFTSAAKAAASALMVERADATATPPTLQPPTPQPPPQHMHEDPAVGQLFFTAVMQFLVLPLLQTETQAVLFDASLMLVAAFIVVIVLLAPRCAYLADDQEVRLLLTLTMSWLLNSLLGTDMSGGWEVVAPLVMQMLAAYLSEGCIDYRVITVGLGLAKCLLGFDELLSGVALGVSIAVACARYVAARCIRRASRMALKGVLQQCVQGVSIQ